MSPIPDHVSQPKNIRTAATGITTSTLMVLVAMASTASAAAPVDGRCGHVEPTTVRAMAAVVAAVARDMIGLERSASAAISRVAVEGVDTSDPAVCTSRAAVEPSPSITLDERLLDLPPPLV